MMVRQTPGRESAEELKGPEAQLPSSSSHFLVHPWLPSLDT